jgi:hypothetical protein
MYDGRNVWSVTTELNPWKGVLLEKLKAHNLAKICCSPSLWLLKINPFPRNPATGRYSSPVEQIHNLYAVVEMYLCFGWYCSLYLCRSGYLQSSTAYSIKLDSVETTNKMQPCDRIYYAIVQWRLNMFRAAYRSSSGALTIFAASGLHTHVVTGRSQVLATAVHHMRKKTRGCKYS